MAETGEVPDGGAMVRQQCEGMGQQASAMAGSWKEKGRRRGKRIGRKRMELRVFAEKKKFKKMKI